MTNKEKIAATYQKYMKDYLRVVAAIDENVGRVLDYLEESGLAENTVVVYTSDQGMFLGEHSYYDKRWMYDESLKMPFIIRKPGEIKAGTQFDEMVTNLDFPELILDYADVSIPETMQGESFRTVLTGNTPENWKKSMYYQYWMQFEPSAVPAHLGVRTHDYKLIFYYGDGLGLVGTTDTWKTPVTWELYDLKKDPFELNNIYGKKGLEKVTKGLKDEILKLQQQYELDVSEYPALQKRMKENWEN
jgi:arylsulfatase A-like enzyme